MYSHHTLFSKTFVYFDASFYWFFFILLIEGQFTKLLINMRITYSFFLKSYKIFEQDLCMTSIFCSHVNSLPLGDLLPVWRWSTAPPVSNEIAFFCRASDSSVTIKRTQNTQNERFFKFWNKKFSFHILHFFAFLSITKLSFITMLNIFLSINWV